MLVFPWTRKVTCNARCVMAVRIFVFGYKNVNYTLLRLILVSGNSNLNLDPNI